VLSLKEALTEWLSHRRNVLIRRSKYRLGKIERRLEILEGYLVVFLNLDEVITIIRETDHPRDELMLRFSLSDVQANAILDMRLRSLRRLEEEALRTERDSLLVEKENLKNLLRDEEEQWQAVSAQIKSMRADFLKTDQRRTTLSDAPTVDIDVTELLIEKEPITVICSGKGWVRAMKGHLDLNAQFKFKDGDGPRFALHAETTDKLLVFAENGRFYTLGCDKLPKGRGFGEPLSLMMDVPADVSLVNIIKVGKGKLLVASDKGHGLIVDIDSALAQTRSGKQVLNLPLGARAVACCPAEGDHAAVVGQNRRLLIFPLNEIPEMTRGKGVILQRYKDGTLADVKTFSLADGLSWKMGERTRTETDLLAWQGRRGSAGRIPPIGFPRPARFT
jgi:topoisomerase-4 subunit A